MHKVNLAAEICQLMAQHNASNRDGMSAIMTALVVGLMDSGVTKERAMLWLAMTWERLEPSLKAFNEAEPKH